jgi:hypothetical protein
MTIADLIALATLATAVIRALPTISRELRHWVAPFRNGPKPPSDGLAA